MTLLFVLVTAVAAGQQKIQLKGKIVDPYTNAPIEGAVVGSLGSSSVQTNENGEFDLEVVTLRGTLNAWAPGYYATEVPIAGRSYIQLVMEAENTLGYSANMQVPMLGSVPLNERVTNAFSLEGSSIGINKSTIEQAMLNIPGLQVIEKSGMPGEGAYLSIRGTNTFTAKSAPLIVINGVPQVLDLTESPVITGYSRSVLNAINPKDIQNITVLSGIEAAMFGSMGSNGVILIETDRAIDLDTKVEYFGMAGINVRQKKLPLLSIPEYKTYIMDVAKTAYSDMASLFNAFPYLRDDPNSLTDYLYNNNTDWQKEIYRVGFQTEHMLKVEGGDEIAKYDLSVGYQGNAGQVDNTKYNKYYVRLNSDVTLHQKLSMAANLTTAYMDSDLAEQGLAMSTNPLLAAFRKSPMLSPYKKDLENNVSPELATIRSNNYVSNPLSVINDILNKSKAYDIQGNVNFKYTINDNLNVTALVGLYYYYTSERLFVPGATNSTIVPMEGGLAKNLVRVGVSQTFNMYYNVAASYAKIFNNVHDFKASLAVQASMNDNEYDAGQGRNTANDYYRTLNNVQSSGRIFYGYNDKWNWLNFNASAQYVYNKIVGVGAVLSVDRSSSTGKDAQLYGVYPAGQITGYLKNTPLFRDVNLINQFNVNVDYTVTGNSQYASYLSKYSYTGDRFMTVTGIVRDGIPNTKLKPEVNRTWSVGIDYAMFNNRFSLTAKYYNSRAKDLILLRNISAAFGTNYMYDNIGEVENKGFEIGAQLAILQKKDMSWYVGGTISKNDNKVRSLGGNQSIITEFSDGSAVITQVGESMNSFYGYKTRGIYQTSMDVASDAIYNGGEPLRTSNGLPFQAGDVRFVDTNRDGTINSYDRQVIGSADPDFFGTFYTNFRYKAFELSAMFTYSYGNQAYNATRRVMESGSDYSNQARSVASHWTMEGQQTNMPRVVYGDPMDNNRFSDRFIEDASYIKLKELMLSYKLPVINGLTVYVAGENLLTFTDYLGIDPEFSYSYSSSMQGFDYAKVALARTFKVGVKLQF